MYRILNVAGSATRGLAELCPVSGEWQVKDARSDVMAGNGSLCPAPALLSGCPAPARLTLTCGQAVTSYTCLGDWAEPGGGAGRLLALQNTADQRYLVARWREGAGTGRAELTGLLGEGRLVVVRGAALPWPRLPTQSGPPCSLPHWAQGR